VVYFTLGRKAINAIDSTTVRDDEAPDAEELTGILRGESVRHPCAEVFGLKRELLPAKHCKPDTKNSQFCGSRRETSGGYRRSRLDESAYADQVVQRYAYVELRDGI